MSSDRIYLIGNGASLKHTNLDLLIGKPSMAVNKIHLIYPFTKWRPTHYVKVDYSVFDPDHPDDWRSEIMGHVNNDEYCLLWDAFHHGAHPSDGNYEWIPNGIGDWHVKCQFIPRCEHHYQLKSVWHPFCTGGNSVLTMVLWAVELGFKEIVLLGFDGKYSTPKKDHFDPSYYSAIDSEYAERNNRCTRQAHEVIAANCPIPIYDATVNGSLDFYPKVRLEEIVQEETLHRSAADAKRPGKRSQNRQASSEIRPADRQMD